MSKPKLTRVTTTTGLAFIHASADLDDHVRAQEKLAELNNPATEQALKARWPDPSNPWAKAAEMTLRAEIIIQEAICAACLAAQAVEEVERLVSIAQKSRQSM